MANVTVTTNNTVKQFKHVGREPIPAPQTATGSGGSVTYTFPKEANGNGVVIERVDMSFGATPTAPSVQISDGTITWGPYNLPTTLSQTPLQFSPPLLFNTAAATSVVVTLSDTGPVAKTLSAVGYLYGPHLL